MSKNDKQRALVPRLRFPEFRDAGEWEEKKLGDVARLKNGYAFNSSTYVESGQFRIVTIANVQSGWLSLESTKRIRSLPDDIQKHQKLDVGDILISMTGNVGRVCRVSDTNLLLNQRVGKLIPCGIHPGFLYQLLLREEFRNAMQLNAAGGAQGNLSSSTITSFGLSLPFDRIEQEKIAECLGSLDELIAAEGRKLAALRDHKKGLMQQLFPREGETRPRLRFPEFLDAGEWKEGRCSDIAQVLTGYGFPEKYQGNFDGEYPFYKVSDISRAVEKGCQYISDSTNYINGDILKKIRAKPVPAGTIIFAKIGEAIRSSRRVVTTKPAVIDNNTAGVKAIKGRSLDEFLFYLWSNVSLIDHAGGVVPAVSKSALENVPLVYPTVREEQQRIADCLSALDALITAQAEKLDALRTHKRGLMQQLFPMPEDV